jgi:hypothetical protein
MMGLVWMLLANAGVLLGARRLTTRFATGHGATDAALFMLFRLMLISAAVLAAGALHVLRPWVLGAAGAVAAGALIAARAHREFIPLWKVPNVPAVYLFAAIALRLLLHTWFLSPFLADVTSYHLPKVAEWVVRGSIFTDLGPDQRAWFPAGMELVDAWWVVFLHHDVLIELAGIEFLALGAASTVALASRLGLAPSAALLAGAIYASVPAMMVQSVWVINDAAAASLVVMAAALIVGRVHPALILAVAGVALGVKATSGFAAPGLVLLWFWIRKEDGPAPAQPVASRAVWAIAAAGLLLGSVWYVRNAVVFHNPLYPAGTEALKFGDQMQNRRILPSAHHLGRNLSDFGERILDRRRAMGGMLEFIAGWGTSVFAFGLMGLLAAVRASKQWRRIASCFALSFLSVLVLADNDPWVLRFVLFAPALLAVAAAGLVEEIRLLRLPLVLLTALTLIGTFFTEDVPVEAFQRSVGLDWRRRSFARDLGVPDVPYARIGCYGDVASMSYLLYRPDLSREVVYLRPSSAEDLIETMERRHLTALYAMTMYDRNGWRQLLVQGIASGRLRRIDHSYWYVLVPK